MLLALSSGSSSVQFLHSGCVLRAAGGFAGAAAAGSEAIGPKKTGMDAEGECLPWLVVKHQRFTQL